MAKAALRASGWLTVSGAQSRIITAGSVVAGLVVKKELRATPPGSRERERDAGLHMGF